MRSGKAGPDARRHGVASARNYRDGAAAPRGAGQALVSGEQGTTQLLGERDVAGVIRRQIVPELPDATQNADKRVADHAQPPPHVQRRPAGVRADLGAGDPAPQAAGDFGVDQVGDVELLGAERAAGGTGIQESRQCGRGIGHDHLNYLLARSASRSAAIVAGSTPRSGRAPSRARLSARRELSASSRTATALTEMPSRSARRLRRSTTSSGTPRRYSVLMSQNASSLLAARQERKVWVVGFRNSAGCAEQQGSGRAIIRRWLCRSSTS